MLSNLSKTHRSVGPNAAVFVLGLELSKVPQYFDVEVIII